MTLSALVKGLQPQCSEGKKTSELAVKKTSELAVEKTSELAVKKDKRVVAFPGLAEHQMHTNLRKTWQ